MHQALCYPCLLSTPHGTLLLLLLLRSFSLRRRSFDEPTHVISIPPPTPAKQTQDHSSSATQREMLMFPSCRPRLVEKSILHVFTRTFFFSLGVPYLSPPHASWCGQTSSKSLNINHHTAGLPAFSKQSRGCTHKQTTTHVAPVDTHSNPTQNPTKHTPKIQNTASQPFTAEIKKAYCRLHRGYVS